MMYGRIVGLYSSFIGLLLFTGIHGKPLLQTGNWDPLTISSPQETKLAEEYLKDCLEFRFDSGIYTVESTGTQISTCGLYLVGPLDTQVAIDFMDFNVGCEHKGLIGVLDGWEQEGYVFPPKHDVHGHHLRYETFCGIKQPKGTFLSSGNMALIQYHLPTPGNGFVVRVQFVKNPQPCNMISMFPGEPYILRNYGQRVNCSMLTINPERITLSLVNVGITPKISPAASSTNRLLPDRQAEADFRSAQVCNPYEKGDYVEIKGGSNISVNNMITFKQLCGASAGEEETFGIFCGSTLVRLVSSGVYDNVVVIETDSLDETEADQPNSRNNVCRLI
ncbi:corticotropin-releasing factor-binding protein-like [Paramacrobiotus metropolitanus]|uniref:corticotropin-releasing factor-binding protein-like n=1 Tax=Paramacrobiotus metropolitanus TaxID=2943436 RepID=UPI002446372C|nr:corticotropin-releasing factor-binding protein-like [Paramacrobiotus metropolitanus]